MKRQILSIFLSCLWVLTVWAQAEPDDLSKTVDRISRFGKNIPQEKVYVHMDNTCYFLGDTIWFAAYTRQSNNNQPSEISKVLYVELLNSDGYLVERKMVRMEKGRGSNYFALNKQIQYAGFYELRAYTRWQLNWGRFEHPHSEVASHWFIDKTAEKDYYQDYDKLYSRVFPVYNRPQTAGEYEREITPRVLRRNYKEKERKAVLSLFPEGGNLIVGVPSRVAFEAAWDDGEWMEGTLQVGGTEAVTVHRGRGVITITPQAGEAGMAIFKEKKSGITVTQSLPRAEQEGMALQVHQTDAGWQIKVSPSASLQGRRYVLTVMHQGVVEFVQIQNTDMETVLADTTFAQPGIRQVTVGDEDGRIYADRLFFAKTGAECQPTLNISTPAGTYAPHEAIRLTVKATEKGQGNMVSVAVRDSKQEDRTFDRGNILTEMLLASEIKGFVPDPQWYFASDDELHRQGLDLLMMTQGWRRFDWRDMAVEGRWQITNPSEQAMNLTGKIYNAYRGYRGFGDCMRRYEHYDRYDVKKSGNTRKQPTAVNKAREASLPVSPTLKREVLVRSELVVAGQNNGMYVDAMTHDNGQFNIQMPGFYGPFEMFVGASDSTKWGRNYRYNFSMPRRVRTRRDIGVTYTYSMDEPEFRTRIAWPYPRFVKPYTFYQNHIVNTDPDRHEEDSITILKEVKVKGRRRGLGRFNDAQPAFIVDAYEAENAGIDAGMLLADEPVARAYVGDMGQASPYLADRSSMNSRINRRYGLGPTRRSLPQYIDIPLDSLYAPKYLHSVAETTTLSQGEKEEYGSLEQMDKYVVYTDYSPRREGDPHFAGSNMPEVSIATYPFHDGSQRVVYRDRRVFLYGFAETAEFYNPDYSRHALPQGEKDCRRTLYWNPNLLLDENAEAQITLYNNTGQTSITVDAQGLSTNGNLLWTK